MKKEPPRLIEALGHIRKAGSLLPMKDVTLPQIDRLWGHIIDNGLATMTGDGGLSWHLTPEGNFRLSEVH